MTIQAARDHLQRHRIPLAILAVLFAGVGGWAWVSWRRRREWMW